MSEIKFSTDIKTDKASRYLQQLCKHWSHKLTVEFNEESGFVKFSSCQLNLIAKEDLLTLELVGNEDTDMDRMKDVVERHLDRFAWREGGLKYNWN